MEVSLRLRGRFGGRRLLPVTIDPLQPLRPPVHAIRGSYPSNSLLYTESPFPWAVGPRDASRVEPQYAHRQVLSAILHEEYSTKAAIPLHLDCRGYGDLYRTAIAMHSSPSNAHRNNPMKHNHSGIRVLALTALMLFLTSQLAAAEENVPSEAAGQPRLEYCGDDCVVRRNAGESHKSE